MSALREIQAGGATISDELLARARKVLPVPLLNTYASTEAGTAALASVELLGDLRNEGAVGFIVPWASVDACDDDGRVLPPGHDGHLRVDALGVAPIYVPGQRKIEKVEPFFPGDFGRVLGNGMLIIGGRSNEVINIGGIKFAPERLENIVLQCRGVKDAAVVAIASEAALPQICVAVTGDATIDRLEIVKQCGDGLRVATPTMIKVLDAIPRNVTGKIMRDRLREIFAADMK